MIATRPSTGHYLKMKRALDAVFALVLLIGLFPLLVALGFLLLVIQGRPILFVQVRPGLKGKPFLLFKFRTMIGGVPASEKQLDGSTITTMGKFLRRFSLDELPQLVNILRGDMSFVGPRPLLMEYLPLYSERQATRHKVRPGLTGLAQVKGRNSLSWERRLSLDAVYVTKVSFFLDLWVIAKTLANVISGNGVESSSSPIMPKFRG
jgi:sugar transferase EpsL